MILIHKDNNRIAEIGDKVKTSKGEIGIINYFAKPHKPASSGKCTIKGQMSEHFVGIWGLAWLFREDQCDTEEERVACAQLEEEYIDRAMDVDAETDMMLTIMYKIYPEDDFDSMGFSEFCDRIGHVTMGDLADHPEEWAPRLHAFHWRNKK